MKNIFRCFLLILQIIVFCEMSINPAMAKSDEERYQKCVFAERGSIMLLDVTKKQIAPLAIYAYDGSDVSINCPSLCFNGSKILFAENVTAENKGRLIILDLKSGEQKILYEGKAIVSPILSPNEREVAFLSDVVPGKQSYTIFVLNLLNMNLRKMVDDVSAIRLYNYNISWMPDNKKIAYANKAGYIFITDSITGQGKFIVHGYDPIISPDGTKLVFNQSIHKPYEPLIYNLITNKIINTKLTSVYNAIWSPEKNQLFLVRKSWKIFSLFNRSKTVKIHDLHTGKGRKVFKFEGYEYWDCE